MFEYRFIDPPGVHFVEGSGSLNLLQLFEVGTDLVSQGGSAGDLSRPTFWDVRKVNLLGLDTQEIKNLIRLRVSLGPEHRNGLMAVVVGDEGSYGIMRMYNSLAEVNDLRPVESTYLGFDMEEAIDWIATAMKLDTEASTAFRSSFSVSD